MRALDLIEAFHKKKKTSIEGRRSKSSLVESHSTIADRSCRSSFNESFDESRSLLSKQRSPPFKEQITLYSTNELLLLRLGSIKGAQSYFRAPLMEFLFFFLAPLIEHRRISFCSFDKSDQAICSRRNFS
ncbi:hypothetical protein ACOSQ2_023311 [Xanthoceras sorbifolium]